MSAPPSVRLRTDPSGKSSWELIRDSARRDLARHEEAVALQRRWARWLLWGAAALAVLFYAAAVVFGWVGGFPAALTIFLMGVSAAGLGIRAEALRYDRTHRPGIEARLRDIEGPP